MHRDPFVISHFIGWKVFYANSSNNLFQKRFIPRLSIDYFVIPICCAMICRLWHIIMWTTFLPHTKRQCTAWSNDAVLACACGDVWYRRYCERILWKTGTICIWLRHSGRIRNFFSLHASTNFPFEKVLFNHFNFFFLSFQFEMCFSTFYFYFFQNLHQIWKMNANQYLKDGFFFIHFWTYNLFQIFRIKENAVEFWVFFRFRYNHFDG